MHWEIVLVVFIIIGIYTAVREAREKRAARKGKTPEAPFEKYPPEGSFRENRK